MKRGVLFMLMMLAISLCTFSQQAKSVIEAQTMFLYNFSRLIQWPVKTMAGDFVFGVIGNDEVYNQLLIYAANKKVGSQNISVKKFENPENVTRCHIVFIGNDKIGKFDYLISRLEGSNCLIVTEKKGMIKSGSAIDMFIEQDKLKYVINQENAGKYNLTMSKTLFDFAYKN